MKNSPNSHRINGFRGFTLVELLVVVSVIVILSGMVIGVAGFAQRKAAVTKAKTQLELFQAKLDEYAQDAQGFPDVHSKDGLMLYRMLFGDGVGPDLIAGTPDDAEFDGQPDESARTYLPDFDPSANQQKMLKFRPGTAKLPNRVPIEVVDPWGNPWQYRSGQKGLEQRNPDFDLWSRGPDGKEDTEDDITNW